MATSGTIPWSQVVAKAAGMKIITPSRRKDPDELIPTTVLYEHSDYQDQQLARKAVVYCLHQPGL